MNKIKLYICKTEDDISEIIIETPIHAYQNKKERDLQRNYENLANAIIIRALMDIEEVEDNWYRGPGSIPPCSAFEEGTEENKQCQKYTNIDLKWIKHAFDHDKLIFKKINRD